MGRTTFKNDSRIRELEVRIDELEAENSALVAESARQEARIEQLIDELSLVEKRIRDADIHARRAQRLAGAATAAAAAHGISVPSPLLPTS